MAQDEDKLVIFEYSQLLLRNDWSFSSKQSLIWLPYAIELKSILDVNGLYVVEIVVYNELVSDAHLLVVIIEVPVQQIGLLEHLGVLIAVKHIEVLQNNEVVFDSYLNDLLLILLHGYVIKYLKLAVFEDQKTRGFQV